MRTPMDLENTVRNISTVKGWNSQKSDIKKSGISKYGAQSNCTISTKITLLVASCLHSTH